MVIKELYGISELLSTSKFMGRKEFYGISEGTIKFN